MIVSVVALVFVLATFSVLIYWAWRFIAVYLFVRTFPPIADEQLPAACVIMPLRGTDPHLADGIRRLLSQDYPRYALRIVIDSRDDPAWDVVNAVIAADNPRNVDVRVTSMEKHCPTCSLKVSAQMQAIAELDAKYEIVAFMDADVVPPLNWLRSLVTPLASDAKTGIATGIRWYAPPTATWGAIVRHLWNSASQTQMYQFSHPWGGSFAIRSSFLKDPTFIDEWKTSLCDDSGAGDLVVDRGYRVEYLPAMTMVNHEAIDLPSCDRFIRRQLLCPRMDLRHWPAMLTANVCMLVSVTLCISFMVAGIVMHEPRWIWWFGGAIAFYFAGQMPVLFLAEIAIRRLVRARGEAIAPPLYSWKLLVAPLLTQALQFYWLYSAVFARRTTWRGVDYRLDGWRRVSLVEYRPYTDAGTTRAANESVI